MVKTPNYLKKDKMKLQLKHLAGYLPYGLELWHNQWKEILIMDCAGSNCDTLSIEDVNEYAKPILRPLSDLTKEIEVNGEKFIPKDVLDETHISNWSYGKITEVDAEMLQNAPFWFTQKFLEWHFDIYGLIEKGLAIDINTM